MNAAGESLLRSDSYKAIWLVSETRCDQRFFQVEKHSKPQTCTTSSLLTNLYEKWQSSLHRHLEGTKE